MENNEVYLVDTSFSDVYKPFLTEGDVIVYLPIASKNGHGVVRPGDGIAVSNGVIRIDDSFSNIKVDRYDVDNLPDGVVFNIDGIKTPNVIFYNYENDVKELNDDVITLKGQLLVGVQDNIQTEVFFTNGSLYIRGIEFTGTTPNPDTLTFKPISGGIIGLQGPKGPTGLQGPQGPQGIQGPQGVQGPKGDIGPSGPEGVQGVQGEQGEQGKSFRFAKEYSTVQSMIDDWDNKDVEFGDIVIILTEDVEDETYGDYYVKVRDEELMFNLIGKFTLGIPVKGDTGPQGPQGVQGPKGDTGPQGERGEQGEQGPIGIQGPAGNTGPMGPMGPQGIQGPKGAKGDKGEKGDTVYNGEQGPQGQKGDKGAPGDSDKLILLESNVTIPSTEWVFDETEGLWKYIYTNTGYTDPATQLLYFNFDLITSEKTYAISSNIEQLIIDDEAVGILRSYDEITDNMTGTMYMFNIIVDTDFNYGNYTSDMIKYNNIHNVKTALNTLFDNKVDKVEGKGLSSYDYTLIDKNRNSMNESNIIILNNNMSGILNGSIKVPNSTHSDTSVNAVKSDTSIQATNALKSVTRSLSSNNDDIATTEWVRNIVSSGLLNLNITNGSNNADNNPNMPHKWDEILIGDYLLIIGRINAVEVSKVVNVSWGASKFKSADFNNGYTIVMGSTAQTRSDNPKFSAGMYVHRTTTSGFTMWNESNRTKTATYIAFGKRAGV